MRRASRLGACKRRHERVQAGPALADDEAADSACEIDRARWIEAREALVDVVVTRENEINPIVVQGVPEPRDDGNYFRAHCPTRTAGGG